MTRSMKDVYTDFSNDEIAIQKTKTTKIHLESSVPFRLTNGRPFTLNVKPSWILKQMIFGFSIKEEIVLNCFSCGQVLRNSLMIDRECFSFCSKWEDLSDLTAYAEDLKSPNSVVRFAKSRWRVYPKFKHECSKRREALLDCWNCHTPWGD